MKYKLCIFDFDGTLADSFPWFIKVINQAAAKYRFKTIDPAEVATLRGYTTADIISYLQIPAWKVPLVVKHMRSLLEKKCDEINIFAGVDSLLQNLSRNGMQLAVVSSNSPANVSQILGPANMACFDYAECGVSMFGKVPKLRKIVRKSRLDNRECIFIGDETRDIEAAKEAGMSSGAVSWGYNSIGALEKMGPDEVFFEIKQLYENLIV